MPEAHTSIILQDALSSSLDQWNLVAEKQVVVTTDSSTNIKLASGVLDWQRLSCFGHNSVHKVLDDERVRVDKILRKCRKMDISWLLSPKTGREIMI